MSNELKDLCDDEKFEVNSPVKQHWVDSDTSLYSYCLPPHEVKPLSISYYTLWNLIMSPDFNLERKRVQLHSLKCQLIKELKLYRTWRRQRLFRAMARSYIRRVLRCNKGNLPESYFGDGSAILNETKGKDLSYLSSWDRTWNLGGEKTSSCESLNRRCAERTVSTRALTLKLKTYNRFLKNVRKLLKAQDTNNGTPLHASLSFHDEKMYT